VKKCAVDRRFANPDLAARKLIEIANDVEGVMDGRIYIERVDAPFLAAGGTGKDFHAGIERAIAKGWLWRHESGTYVKSTNSGAALLTYVKAPAHPRRSLSMGHSPLPWPETRPRLR
jgi:hypothetical protein